jgi:hypothetical protein
LDFGIYGDGCEKCVFVHILTSLIILEWLFIPFSKNWEREKLELFLSKKKNKLELLIKEIYIFFKKSKSQFDQ